MKVIDLYKQLEILIKSGQENLPVMISTSIEYTPLEVVDIQEGECCLCDTWTPVFDDDKTVKQQAPPHIESTEKTRN